MRVLVVDGDYGLCLRVVRTLGQAPGIHIDVLSRKPRLPVRFSRHVASFRTHEATERDAVLAEIARAVRDTGAEVVLPLREQTIAWLAESPAALAGARALLPDPEMMAIARDKGRLAAFASRAGIPCPQTRLLNSDADLHAAMAELRFPLILKHRTSAFGQNILRVQTPDELRSAAGRLPFPLADYLVQEFIPGEDFGCCLACRDGQLLAASTQRELLPASSPWTPPAAWELVAIPEVQTLIARLMAELRWTGVADVDLLRDARDGSYVLLEINARFWGSVMAAASVGVNFPHLYCLAALGRPLPDCTPRTGRFYINGLGFKKWMQTLLGRAEPGFRLHETQLPATLADPLPEIMERMLPKLEQWRPRRERPTR